MRRVLVCVDVQKGFVNDASRPAVEPLLCLARDGGFDEVWATRFLNPGPSGLWMRRMHWGRFQEGTDEADLVPELAALHPRVFSKHSYAAPVALIDRARGLDPVEVFIGGIDTDVCVLTLATQLFDAGIPPFVVTNACRSHGGPESHEAGLRALRRIIGEDGLVELPAAGGPAGRPGTPR